MLLLQRITNTRMARGENPLPLARQRRRIELHLHQLVHVLHDQHIAIQLHDPVVLDQAERRQLGPAVVEARVGRVVLAGGG